MRPAPLFGTIVIAGVGLIGGSVGLGIRQRFLAHRTIGLDQDPAALDAARGLGIIDATRLAVGEWLGEADLVVLATPARAIAPLARAMAPHLGPDAIVTDVGSVKAGIVAELRDLRFVGGHPMAGSDKAGVLHADAALLENAVWVLTPDERTDAGALQRVDAFVTALGARPLRVAPERHDRLVATVSHLPYLAAVALTALVDRGEERELTMLLAAGGFRDLTRVASGSPLMSRDMVAGNREAVRGALRAFRAELEGLEALLDDDAALLARAEAAKRVRDGIPIVRRSLLPARHELVIAVPDRPGEFAKITRALGEAAVNIKDLEVLGIREAGGAVRIAVESDEALARARRALEDAGYEARSRNGG
ncbi:MAG TPA: prephenate dehydrogenase/arogenate dehydrogenase family protein [Trueperaceae bacterium]|nr:prephenate dehydrogenase/arogenate dehydrogenase family protein [Trueperaceae bacterium]